MLALLCSRFLNDNWHVTSSDDNVGKLVMGRYTEKITDIGYFEKAKPIPKSVFQKPINTENRRKKTENTEESFFSVFYFAIIIIVEVG